MTTGTATGQAQSNQFKLSKAMTPVKEQEPRTSGAGIRKKSIRHAKDSAEMARIKYHRKWRQDDIQSQHRARSPVFAIGRLFGVGHAGNTGSAKPTTLTREAYATQSARPLTPPYTADTDQQTGFYWHDSFRESTTTLLPPPLSNPRLLEAQGCDGFYMSESSPAELHLPLQGTSGQHEPHNQRRLRTPISNLPGMGGKSTRSQAQPNPVPPGLGTSFLQVPIPSPRLGRPQFTDSGSAILRNSINTAHSSNIDVSHNTSHESFHKLFPAPPTHLHPNVRPREADTTTLLREDDAEPAAADVRPLRGDADTAVHGGTAEDLHRYSWASASLENNEELSAATRARLVTEITSVKFLDYDLTSDFFLTYRSFMTPDELCRHLFARLRWAVFCTEPKGRVVRVRTFVALRHWVLNYFIDDFEPDFALRALFCDLVNGLARDLQQRPGGGGGDGQVLNELKKCWKRTCELVWGLSDPANPYDFAHPSGALPVVSDAVVNHVSFSVPAAAGAQGSATAYPGGSAYTNNSPSTGPVQDHKEVVPASPSSDTSCQANSCSVPFGRRGRACLCSDVARPVSKSTPAPRKIRKQRHTRSASLDALGVDRGLDPAPVDAIKAPEPLPTFMPGELIRGALVHPTFANIVRPGPLSPAAEGNSHADMDANADHNQGVCKLLGCMCKVLGTQHGYKHHAQASPNSRQPTDRDGSGHFNQYAALPKSASDTLLRTDQSRFDTLAAVATRSWQQQREVHELSAVNTEVEAGHNSASAQSTNIIAEERRLGITRYNSNVTAGSRSIFIINDTDDLGSSAVRGVAPTSGLRIYRRASDSDISSAVTPNIPDNSAIVFSTNEPPLPTSQGWTDDHLQPSTAAMTGAQRPLGAPLSPPPSAPLPPLPRFTSESTGIVRPRTSYQSAMRYSEYPISIGEDERTPLSQIGIALGTPPSRLSMAQTRFDGVSIGTQIRRSDEVNTTRPRVLRRNGGGWRLVDGVDGPSFLRRRQSTGSLSLTHVSTPSSSVAAAEIGTACMASMWFATEVERRFSGQRVSGTQRRSSIRLLSTHSSQPNLRESFEVEMKNLASMPLDDEDGDAATTLLKLEGRFQPSPGPDRDDVYTSATPVTETMGASTFNAANASNASLNTVLQVPDLPTTWTPPARIGVRFSDHEITEIMSRATTPSAAPLVSQDSEPMNTQAATFAADIRESTAAAPSSATQSTFLLVDDDEPPLVTSHQVQDRPNVLGPQHGAIQSFYIEEDDEDEHLIYQPTPRTPYPSEHGTPPTPPDSDIGSATTSPSLLLPGPPLASGSSDMVVVGDGYEKRSQNTSRTATPQAQMHVSKHIPSQHTPFVLAYSSSVLASQFTLIEKDALDCIDWKDLINLSWSRAPIKIPDWAMYVHSISSPSNDISSIDTIIARFNLVTRWCISSILLCVTPQDRATCITKFIHIAHHARTHLHNFATAAQITLGLLSSDLTRLTKTWTLVPSAEKAVLANLEDLVKPVSNFVTLREEMDKATTTALLDAPVAKNSGTVGVIPFMVVFMKDLMTNAQKPALVAPTAGSGDGEQRINFERHRTAAGIVKGVLRLLDASSKYAIRPDVEVLSKCLWLAALSDEEITALSKSLE